MILTQSPPDPKSVSVQLLLQVQWMNNTPNFKALQSSKGFNASPAVEHSGNQMPIVLM